MDDLISRKAAIDALQKEIDKVIPPFNDVVGSIRCGVRLARNIIEDLSSAQPEIVRCKDCKFYSQMNWETKTGICNLTMHQNFGDNWFCAGAERRTDERLNQ